MRDHSSDDSVKYVTKNFPRIRIIKNGQNLGFAKTANRGVEAASGSLVALINSDVAPRKNSVTLVSSYFDDPDVFAVGLCDLSHEKNKIIKRGRGGAKFKHGFVEHFATTIKKGDTFWVSGIFEQDAQVDHFHEKGAIKKSSSSFFIKVVVYRNQFLFGWKNIDNYFLIIQHVLWLPYHIIRAAASFDFAFHLGLLWAIARSWRLVIDSLSDDIQNKISEIELFRKFNEK
ncbi:MAG: Glycosyl transferase, group 2 family protein [Candidatus Curtissbacteria bacterium GW2011_GWA1_41_11]|uniref:Glycosyl transferase, group 2 family protein n=1 Tax=Candidatus Curtissbacteria bacterium GW2011_GWA1_41_11 TaxID=1618409 RepID=A0A0G0XE97_9BACT|nr:MAG: Glycosyl transferase, group 2 family protein [Candidatus Curtissbacteria bacterium GW2011_GWA1_41_11]